MRIEPLPGAVRIHTPAKINLFLDVLGKRPDGYHELQTVMTAITVFDTLEYRWQSAMSSSVRPDSAAADASLEISGRADESSAAVHRAIELQDRCAFGIGIGGSSELPPAESNLAVRALRQIRQKVSVEPERLSLTKRIPSAAGLGGGSSDAVAALLAARIRVRQTGSDVQRSVMQSVAAGIGSDVPFFLTGGTAVCCGRGEIVRPVRFSGRLHLVLLQPPTGLSTAAVFSELNIRSTSADSQSENGKLVPRAAAMVRALQCGDVPRVASLLFNRLQPPAQRLSSSVYRVRQAFRSLNLLGHQMSGSGSCYFGICRHARHARRVVGILRSLRLGRVFRAVTEPGYDCCV